MSPVTAIIMLAAALYLLQGIVFLLQGRRLPQARWFGLLTVLLTGLGLTSFLLSKSGSLVLSPEFGIVMAQGSFARATLALLIMGLASAIGLGWHVSGESTDGPRHIPWLLGAGIVIGFLGVTGDRLFLLNPADVTPLHVFSYDLWLPLMQLWLAIGLTGIGLRILRIGSRVDRLWVTSGLVGVLALWAMGRPEFAYPLSEIVWKYVLIIAIAFNTGLSSWYAMQAFKQGVRFHRAWSGILPGLIAGWVSLGLGMLWLSGARLAAAITPWYFWVEWLVLVAFVSTIRLFRMWRAGMVIRRARPPLTLRQGMLLTSLGAFTLSLLDLLYFARIDPSITLIILILAWIFMDELLGGGPVRTFANLVRAGRRVWDVGSPLRAHWPKFQDKFGAISQRVGGWLKGLGTVTSWPAALVKTLVGIVVLIALSDLPNAGKTMIQPFRVPVSEAPDGSTAVVQSFKAMPELAPKDLGYLIADHLLQHLDSLRRELQAEAVRFQPSIPRGRGPAFAIVATGEGTNLNATLAKSDDLQFGNIKIPLGLLVSPVQGPMRRLLGVRVITGGIQIDEHTYGLLASSSRGESWKVQFLKKDLASTDPPSDPVAALTRQLAFRILSADPVMGSMTNSWDSYRFFRRGLDNYELFETQQSYDGLTDAIAQFRMATQADPNFTLAHYRLGLASQTDGQPAAAAEAFRASLRTSPGFIPGYMALAATLYDFDYYYYWGAAAFSSVVRSEPITLSARASEARRLWGQVILSAPNIASPEDRASAYYGMCRAARDNGQQALAYLYCRRAASVYLQLPRSQRAWQSIRAGEGVVLNLLGEILEKKNGRIETAPARDWHCDANTIDDKALTQDKSITVRELWKSPHGRSALRYYLRARVLLPDDQKIRCNIAAATYALGDPRVMEALKEVADAHSYLAENYRTQAKGYAFDDYSDLAALYYRAALDEYQRAIDRDPSNVAALNNYAFTFWEWRLHSPHEDPPAGPTSKDAHQAEEYARRAIMLVTGTADRVMKVITQATLGEVLLAHGRPHEADEVLQAFINEVPKHPLFHEVRWDMAQAYLCAAKNDVGRRESEPQVSNWRTKAKELLRQIQLDEEKREVRPFSRNPRLLDPAWTRNVCTRDVEYSVYNTPLSTGPDYELRDDQPAYGGYLDCNWMGVIVDVYDIYRKQLNTLRLHLWGGGIDRRIRVGEPRDNVFLSHTPKSTHDYYFAQLEDAEGNPNSKVYSVETFANEGPDPCSRNLITLIFDQRR